MGQPIMNAAELARTGAMGSTQYNSLAHALSEFIDNSIEGNATNIFIIYSQPTKFSEKAKYPGYTITILDDGEGISHDFFPKALTRGETTKAKDQDNTIGRFGLGLKEAGNYIAERIELYTWQNYSPNLQYIYYDNEETAKEIQREIPSPMLISKNDFPPEFLKYSTLKFDGKIFEFKKSGVMIQLKKQILGNNKKPDRIYKEVEQEIGRIFKNHINEGLGIYFIDDIKNLEPQKIELLDCTFTLPNSYHRLKKIYSPNDANSLEYSILKDILNGKTTLFETVIEDSLDVQYTDFSTNTVKDGFLKFKVTKIRESIYYKLVQLGGGRTNNIKISDYIKDFQKISILRSGREIEFDLFKFVQVSNAPQHRWWGLDISFDPVLDSLMKVAKNKQGVVLNKNDSGVLTNMYSIWEFIKINIIDKYLDPVIKKNAEIATNAKNDLVDLKHKAKHGVEEKSISSLVANKKYQDEINKVFLTTLNSPTPSDQLEFGKNQKIDFKIDLIEKQFKHSDLAVFVDYVILNGKLVIYLNPNHIYYKEFYSELKQFEKEQFNCLLFALFKSIDEMIDSEESNRKLLSIINKNITNFIIQFLEEIKIKS